MRGSRHGSTASEEEAGPDEKPAMGPRMVTISGARGDVDVFVSGPISDLDALAAVVERLLRSANWPSKRGARSNRAGLAFRRHANRLECCPYRMSEVGIGGNHFVKAPDC